jgi:hypothetical protein
MSDLHALEEDAVFGGEVGGAGADEEAALGVGGGEAGVWEGGGLRVEGVTGEAEEGELSEDALELSGAGAGGGAAIEGDEGDCVTFG